MPRSQRWAPWRLAARKRAWRRSSGGRLGGVRIGADLDLRPAGRGPRRRDPVGPGRPEVARDTDAVGHRDLRRRHLGAPVAGHGAARLEAAGRWRVAKVRWLARDDLKGAPIGP